MSDALTRSAIVELRERHARGESALSLSRAFGLARKKCDAILRGSLFPEVPGPIAPPPKCRRQTEALTLVAAAVAQKRHRQITPERVAELLELDKEVARKRLERMTERGHLELSPVGLRVSEEGRAKIKQLKDTIEEEDSDE